MTFEEKLTTVFERGASHGFDCLTPSEQRLFLIQEFIIDYEMGGLSGYFYNRLLLPKQIATTIDAMRQYHLSELADLVREASILFTNYDESRATGTWNDILREYDPSNRLERISNRIASLNNYGIRPGK
jgi:hypothetical protein